MTEMTTEADIRLEVVSYGCWRKVKREKDRYWAIDLKKKKRIKDWKKRHMPNQWIYKKNWLKKKEKMEKEENEGRYEHFFVFTDFEFWTVACLIVLFFFYIWFLQLFYCNVVNLFDMRKSGTLVWEK